jgi:ATP adenylyltransferase
MKEIWAPWRIEYIKQAKDGGCFLCRSFRSRRDRRNHVIRRGKTCAVVLNRYPYTGGHLMVAPLRHVPRLQSLRPAELAELMQLTVESLNALERSIAPHGFNVGINIGAAAGAGLKDHIHLHVVPRWVGDTNFMPVLGKTKIIPVSLDSLWRQLRKALRERKPRRTMRRRARNG